MGSIGEIFKSHGAGVEDYLKLVIEMALASDCIESKDNALRMCLNQVNARLDVSQKRSQAGKKGAYSRWQNDGKPDGKSYSKVDGKPDGKSYSKVGGKQHGKTIAIERKEIKEETKEKKGINTPPPPPEHDIHNRGFNRLLPESEPITLPPIPKTKADRDIEDFKSRLQYARDRHKASEPKGITAKELAASFAEEFGVPAND